MGTRTEVDAITTIRMCFMKATGTGIASKARASSDPYKESMMDYGSVIGNMVKVY